MKNHTSGLPSGNVIDRIKTVAPSLSEAMARISQLVQDDPQALLNITITELANRAETSPATVTRFCKQVGFSGYMPFRVALAESVGRDDATDAWDSAIGRSFGPSDTPDDIMRSVLDVHTRTLLATSSGLDLNRLTRVAQAIAGCRQLIIFGVGGSAMVGRELQARLFRIGVNAHMHSEVHAGLTAAALADETCVALAISNSGQTTDTTDFLGLAEKNAAFTVAITSYANSILARTATETLLTAIPDLYIEPDNIGPRQAQLFLADLIYLFVAQQDFARTSRNLAVTGDAVAPPVRPKNLSRKPEQIVTLSNSKRKGKPS